MGWSVCFGTNENAERWGKDNEEMAKGDKRVGKRGVGGGGKRTCREEEGDPGEMGGQTVGLREKHSFSTHECGLSNHITLIN